MIYRPSFAVLLLLSAYTNCLGQFQPPKLEKELRSETSNFRIMLPTVPRPIREGTATVWAEGYPIGKPPHQFFSVVHRTNIDESEKDGNLVVKNLEILQSNVSKSVGGTILEITPIRWKGHIGLRATMINNQPGFPSPTVTTSYLMSFGKDLYILSYGALAFGGKDFTLYQVNKGALDLFRTFQLIKDVEAVEKHLKPRLEGSWVVRKAIVKGEESQDEVGAEYSFDGSNFRRLSAEVLETGDAPWPNATFPCYGTYVVDAKLGHLDFRNEPSKELGLIQAAIYKFEKERLLVCVGPESNEENDRPTSWESTQSNSYILLELTRPGDL